MNSINAPLELCEQVRGRFLQFLNNYVVADGQDDAQPSQSITHSQGSGAAGQWDIMRGSAGQRSQETRQLLDSFHGRMQLIMA
jgi:hypothetical protein